MLALVPISSIGLALQRYGLIVSLEWLEENFHVPPGIHCTSSSIDLLTTQVNRLSMSPERQATVSVRARGRPPHSDVEKERRRLAIKE